MITLSRRQIGDADRVGGIELLILWPASLGAERPDDLDVGCEREATAAEKAAAEELIRESCQAAGLVPVHTRVARVVRPRGQTFAGEARLHLAVIIIGRR